MKAIIEKIFSARMLTLVLAVCAASGAWADVPTPVVVWDGDFSSLSKTVTVGSDSVTYSIGNVPTDQTDNNNYNIRSSDNSYLQIVNKDNGTSSTAKAITITASGGEAPFGSERGTTVIIHCKEMPIAAGSNRAIITLLDNSNEYNTGHSHLGIARVNSYSGGGNTAVSFVKEGAGDSSFPIKANILSGAHQLIAFTYKSDTGMAYYLNGEKMGSFNPTTSSFTTPDGVCIGGLDYLNSSKFYNMNKMKIYAIALFDWALSETEVAEYKTSTWEAVWDDDYKWRYNDTLAYRGMASETDFAYATYAAVDRAGNADVTTFKNKNINHHTFYNYVKDGTNYAFPGVALVFDLSNCDATANSGFTPLAIGGLNVTAARTTGETPVYYDIKASSGNRQTMLGDPSGEKESYFVFDKSFSIQRDDNNERGTPLYGTLNISIEKDHAFTLNTTCAKGATNIVLTAGSNTEKPCLKMSGRTNGNGQFTVKNLDASAGKLDYSALDPSSQATTPFINGLLTVSDNTTYAFPALSGAATYKAANKLSADATRTTTFTIGENEYTAPLTFTASTGEIAFPAVATLNDDTTWAAISWDAKPATIGNTTVATLNITGNTTLDIAAATSVKKLVLNISDGVTLTLTNAGNLTIESDGIVIRGTGTLKISGAVSVPALTVEDNATILYNTESTSLTVTGAITVTGAKILNLTLPQLSGASATFLSAGSIDGLVNPARPIEEGYTYSILNVDGSYKLVRTPNVAFSYDGTIGAAPSGWFSDVGEAFASNLRVGPSSAWPLVYEVTTSEHPYNTAVSWTDKNITFALYADVSQVSTTGKPVLVCVGGSGADNRDFLVLYRDGDKVKLAVWNTGVYESTASFMVGSAAYVDVPASGYHLYTATFNSTTGGLTLYKDDVVGTSGSAGRAVSLPTGFQIGNVYMGSDNGSYSHLSGTHGLAKGVGMAFAAIRGYDAVLASDNVAALCETFSATANSYTHTVDLNAAGKTLTVYSTTFTGSCYLGVSNGALVIPENNTVSVPHVRLQESAGTVTADIYGRLEVTSVSTGPNVHWDGDANEYKGILFGKTSGAGTGSVTIHSTGALVAPNAWLQTVFRAGNQTITIDGGLMQVKGLFSDLANKSSLVLQNGGTLEVDSVTDKGQSIAANLGYGTFKIAADVTLPNKLSTTFSGSLTQPTTLNPNGHTLTLQDSAFTGDGYVTVGGISGSVVFPSGSSFTGRLILNDTNYSHMDISSYTGAIQYTGTGGAGLAALNNFAGTVYFTSNVDASSIDLSGAKVVVADNVTYTATIGNEGAMTLGEDTIAKLIGTTETQIKYDGYVPNITGSGSVQYWDDAETPVRIVDGYTIDGNSETTGLISGVNLVPYYYVWEVAAEGTAGIANGSAGWSRIESNVRPVDGKNIAFHIQGTAGQVTTITVDDNATFGSIVVYGTGTAKFVSSENKTISVTTLVTDTPVQIGQGAVAVSGIIRDNSAVAFTGTQTIGVEITGTGAVYAGDATTASAITFTLCNSFTGGLIVKANAVAKTTDEARADGIGTGFGAYGGTVTVYTGGQVDVANTSGVCYDYVIEDGGESETPALTNSGSVIGINARQARSLTVNADAIIECPASKGWGLVNDGHGTANLTLKKGITLTKKGAGTFILCKTVIDNSGSAETLPKLVIAEGNVSTENTGSGGADAWDIDIEDGGKLLLEKGIGARNITVKNGGKITMSGSDGWLNGLTALTINAGGEVDCSGTTKTDNLINATTLTVNGTLNMGTHIGQISATTIAGSGTIVYAGVASKNPAADTIFSTQAGWTGTVKLSAITGSNRIRTEFGHGNSHLQLAGAEGYFMASASGTEFSVPVEFVDGASGYAWKMNSGWTDASTGRSITLLNTISGTGKIWHPSTSEIGHCYVFKTATGYSGSILIENAKGAIIEFGSTAPSQGARSYGSINVAPTGSAVIGSGQSWQATNGIKIEGQVNFAGTATMASATTIASGATLVFEDGASLAFTAATTPVTLPESGTVNINANAMTSLTSEGATIITSTSEFTADDVAKLVSVGPHVFGLDAEDAKKINVYPAVAKVGDTYYTNLATAEAAVNVANPSITIYSGSPEDASIYHDLGDSIYRLKNQNVYLVGGTWSSSAVFWLADNTPTTVYDGDTVVIDGTHFTGLSLAVDPTGPANATSVKIDKDISLVQSADGTILAGTTFTIADGATLTISGASRAVTLGAVTFDKAADTGAVTLDGSANAITLGGNLAGTAPATITGTVIATGKTIANTLKNTTGGTIVYDGTLPGTAPTFDASWTGTVWLKNYTSLTGTSKQGASTYGTTNFEPNSYGNVNSAVKFTGVKGYLTAPDDGSYTIQPALELEDDGETPGLLLYNGWGYNANAQCYTIIRELKGSGTLKADPTIVNNSIPGLNVLLQVRKWDNFTGTLNMPNKNIVFGSTRPEQSLAEGGGKIFVCSGSISIPSTKTWTCVTNFVESGASMVLPSSSALTGTIAGGGTVECNGFQPAITLADSSAWTGTVWIKNIGTNGETAKVGTSLGNGTDTVANTTAQSWGNANSFVKFTNVRGYLANANCPWTLVLEDDGDNKAWYNNNGWASISATFKALKGTGTFYNKHAGDVNVCKQKVTFTSVDDFTGTIYADGMRIGIGGDSTQASDDATGRGTIEIKSGTTASIAAGKTWTTYSTNGFIVNGTISVSNGGALSGKIAGSGTITYAVVPASALKFGTWTGTIELPSFGAGGEDLNNYGVTNSKVKLNGVTNGYFGMGTEGSEYTINPEIVLAGDLVLTDSSTRTWRFKKISGSGDFSLTPGAGNYNITVNATKMTDYTGTIVNNMGTAFTVDELALATAPASGTKILSTGGTGTVTLSAVTVGGAAATFGVKKGDDGYYAGYASTTTGEGSEAVTTVDASSEVSEVAVTVPASYSGKVVIPANVKKLTITGETVPAANIGLKAPYAGHADNIYYGIVTIGEGNVVSLNGEATVGGVKVQPEVKTGDSITPMTLGASAPIFKVKTIPGLYYAVRAAGSLSDLAENCKYGEPVQATGSSIDNLEAPTFPGPVIYYKIDAGVDEEELTRTIISTTQVANTPVGDSLFVNTTYVDASQCYRIPAMAATPDGSVVMGIYDARTDYYDLGVALTEAGERDKGGTDHYPSIDIGGCYSLDNGGTWSTPEIMIDVANFCDPSTGTKQAALANLTKEMELGDPCIVYDSANSQFVMMGITGGGLTTVGDDKVDVVVYTCSLASVKSGNPKWEGPSSVKAAIETALDAALSSAGLVARPSYDAGYQGILQCPGGGFVLRKTWNDLAAGTVVWPMQYCCKSPATYNGGLFVAWQDGEGVWHATAPISNATYKTQEGALTQLDDGSLYFMAKDWAKTNNEIVRPFFKYDVSSKTWACTDTLPQSVCVQGSMLRIGAKDETSVYAAAFCTGNDTSRQTYVRENLRLFIGTDNSATGGVTWNSTPYCTIYAGDTGTKADPCYGYSSLVMLDETTLGVLYEAHGHIYFTKVDVSSALK